MRGYHRTDLHVVLYGDVNANLVDGASIWLQSTATMLAGLGLDRFEVVLKAPIERQMIVGPLDSKEGLELVTTDEVLSPSAAARKIADRAPDITIVRGSKVAQAMARQPQLRGRLWTYLTDIPQHPMHVTPERLEDLRAIIEASEILLCQTDALRGHLETLLPAACGRTVLFPPMLPLNGIPRRRRSLGDGPVRLAYAGKFAPSWRTLEMTGLPARFEKTGTPVEVELIGDKIHAGPAGQSYRQRMREALESTEGVTWVGALSREETLQHLVRADFGLAWRDSALDVSLELSTKLLEYGALRLPALLNRTNEHVALLGADYPFFVANEDDIVDVVRTALRRPNVYRLGVERLASLAEGHSLTEATARFAKVLARWRPRATVGPPGRRTRLLVASHDLKFFEPIAKFLGELPSVDLRFDHWEHLLRHDEQASRAALQDADVVFCEWAGPNAVWYSHHVKPEQRLVVRLHRFELYRRYPRQMRMPAVDAVVCVNEHYRRLAIAELEWSRARVASIPNYVDTLDLARSKVPDAAFRIGMIGITPMRKRMDLAVELVARLRRIDPRFSLVAKSKLPWEYEWIWSKPEERSYAEGVFRRIESDPDVRGAVHMDPFGPNVAQWLRRVGWVVSTSEDESFHLATAEGMASGAVPVVRDWEGADGIYGDRWTHATLDEMVDHIARGALEGTWASLAAAAQREAQRWDVTSVARRFESVLLS